MTSTFNINDAECTILPGPRINPFNTNPFRIPSTGGGGIHEIPVDFEVVFHDGSGRAAPTEFLPRAFLHRDNDEAYPRDWCGATPREPSDLEVLIQPVRGARHQLPSGDLATRWSVTTLKARNTGKHALMFMLYPALAGQPRGVAMARGTVNIV
ncbi:hypothetical protein MN608_10860 [Microdochium nivale]|nr:hypothetical protein MN608_10860 [Microdochium nivale]